MKNLPQLAKTFIRNEHLFWSKASQEKFKLFADLISFSRSYSPLQPDFISQIENFDLEARFFNREKIILHGLDAVDSLKPIRQLELFGKIETILRAYNFGKEWRKPLIAYAMTGIMCPPVFNLHVNKRETPLSEVDRRRVILSLNPDTSMDDIKNAWPEIKRAQRTLWPSFRKFNLTKRSRGILREHIRVVAKKLYVPDKEKYKKLNLSFYEEQLLKYERRYGKSDKDITKTLSSIRKERNGSARESIKIKNRRTDQELVQELYKPKNKKEERRVINKIRQRRRRIQRR